MKASNLTCFLDECPLIICILLIMVMDESSPSLGWIPIATDRATSFQKRLYRKTTEAVTGSLD
jgi:hypothetical protein